MRLTSAHAVRSIPLAAALIVASPLPAHAAGFLFAPDGAHVEVRSVLASWRIDADATELELSVEVDGDPADLVWILPVPEVPSEAQAVPYAALEALEVATRPDILLPASDPCPSPPPASSGNGCSCGGEAATPTGTATVTERPGGVAPTTRRATLEVSSPIELEPLDGARTRDLVARLAGLGLSTSTTTEAALGRYFARPEFPALWVRLPAASRAGAARLPTLRLRFAAGARTALPLVDAAIAAPRVDLRLILVADGPYLSDTWVGIAPRTADMVAFGDGTLGYGAWAARASASAAGHFFALEAVTALDGAVVTRVYGRPPVELLDLEPSFRPHPQQRFRVEPLLDLSDHPSLYSCNELVPDREPAACGKVFCGAGAVCLLVDGAPGCRCPDGAAATTLADPDGALQVTCTPTTLPALPAPIGDPCAGTSCGQGRCLPRGGRALCACDAGAVAVMAGDGVDCVAAPADAETFGPGGGAESRASSRTLAALDGLAAPRREPLAPASLAALGLLLALTRLRRRAS